MNNIKIGMLGAAAIGNWGIVQPCRKVGGIELYAVAARNKDRANSYAKKYAIPVVHTCYEDLLADPMIDAIYNPLPNSLHCEWTIKALDAGKHVLCEKPFASNAQEARQMQLAAQKNNRVLMEAFHYRFHPMAQRMQDAVKLLGKIRHIETNMCVPLKNKADIRYDYSLAGGSTMDVGAYTLHLLRSLAIASLTDGASENADDLLPQVTSAKATLLNDVIDRAMKASFVWPNGMTGSIHCSLWSMSLLNLSAHVYGENGELHVINPYLPHLWNRFKLKLNGKTVKERIKGDSTYTYQLRSFLQRIENGPTYANDLSDAIANMRLIDSIYEKAGLPLRGCESQSAFAYQYQN